MLISADVSPAEGYVTIRRMRDTLSAKDIAIVALLPAGDEADCDGVLNAGADECLAGPICWHSLSAVVQRRLSSRDAQ